MTAAAQGAAVRARYIDMLQCSPERPLPAADANSYTFYDGPDNHPVWLHGPSLAVRRS